MTRRKLIFFTGAHPGENPRPIWLAYHFAEVAAGAGLEAEVRLAGDAVRVAQPGATAGTDLGEALDEKVRAGASAPFLVSL
jgi:hypothetical protein